MRRSRHGGSSGRSAARTALSVSSNDSISADDAVRGSHSRTITRLACRQRPPGRKCPVLKCSGTDHCHVATGCCPYWLAVSKTVLGVSTARCCTRGSRSTSPAGMDRSRPPCAQVLAGGQRRVVDVVRVLARRRCRRPPRYRPGGRDELHRPDRPVVGRCRRPAAPPSVSRISFRPPLPSSGRPDDRRYGPPVRAERRAVRAARARTRPSRSRPAWSSSGGSRGWSERAPARRSRTPAARPAGCRAVAPSWRGPAGQGVGVDRSTRRRATSARSCRRGWASAGSGVRCRGGGAVACAAAAPTGAAGGVRRPPSAPARLPRCLLPRPGRRAAARAGSADRSGAGTSPGRPGRRCRPACAAGPAARGVRERDRNRRRRRRGPRRGRPGRRRRGSCDSPDSSDSWRVRSASAVSPDPLSALVPASPVVAAVGVPASGAPAPGAAPCRRPVPRCGGGVP